MLLLSDGRLDDGGVEGVGDQADDEVVLRKLGVQGLVVGDIERDGDGVLDTDGERLGGFESSASCRNVSGLANREVLFHSFRRLRGKSYQQSR